MFTLNTSLALSARSHPQTYHTRCEILVPPSQAGYDKVVKTTHQSGYEQRLSLVASLGSAHQYLRGSRSLRERILAVHIAYEVLAERNKERIPRLSQAEAMKIFINEVVISGYLACRM